MLRLVQRVTGCEALPKKLDKKRQKKQIKLRMQVNLVWDGILHQQVGDILWKALRRRGIFCSRGLG